MSLIVYDLVTEKEIFIIQSNRSVWGRNDYGFSQLNELNIANVEIQSIIAK